MDENYIDTLGLRLLEGRNFNSAIASDQNKAMLVNERLVELMEWENPLNKKLRYSVDVDPSYVVGVLEDYHFQGLQHEVEPIILWYPLSPNFSDWDETSKQFVSRVLTVSVSDQHIPQALMHLEEKWNALGISRPFEYELLEDSLKNLYSSDTTLLKLLGIFSGISFLITIIGVVGLCAFTTEQRTKELGIRKVLGATRPMIIINLLDKMVTSMLVAGFVASFASFWIMKMWLDNFYYHGDISILILVYSALITFTISILVLIAQSLHISNIPPVISLRYE